jgi:hypothetical protein
VKRFQDLLTAAAAPRLLSVEEDYSGKNDDIAKWVFSPEFRVGDRFEELAQQAGECLGSPAAVDPLSFWLERLCLYLSRRPKSQRLRIHDPGTGRTVRFIKNVIKDSMDFSAWLSDSPKNAISVLAKQSSESPHSKNVSSSKPHSNNTPLGNGGEAWAAKKNRQQELRAHIVQTLQNLGIDQKDWPKFIKDWYAEERTGPRFSYKVHPPVFQPPVYNRVAQSEDEWEKVAMKAWEDHLGRFLAGQHEAERLGIDEKVPAKPKTRGLGKTRRNSDVDLRYKWAALRLRGTAWKEIAFEYRATEDRVRKAASQLLKLAGWAHGGVGP